MFHFKEEQKNHHDNKSDDCPMCSIDEELIGKLKKEAEREKTDRKEK
jgi:hypothetical protein